MDNIPIIDMAKIGDIPNDVKNDNGWKYTAGKIREALGNIGFLYLKNHGIDKTLITKAFTEIHKFFDLPQDIKLKYKKGAFEEDFNKWFGYSRPGEELLSSSSLQELRESFDFLQGIEVDTNLEVSDFYSAFSELYNCCNELAKKVVILFAISLNLDDPKYFLNVCANIDDLSLPRSGNMRALHYPPIPKNINIPSGTVRLGEHSDYGMLTLLFQDMIDGLEVKTVDQKWIAASPIPGTILVNTGDLLEFWTSGVFPATKHRVIMPEDPAQKYADRYSIGYFLGPSVDTIVSPMKIEKTESEEARLAVSSGVNYDNMKPINSMKYVLDKAVKSYAKNRNLYIS